MIRIKEPTDASSISDLDLRDLINLRLSQLSDGDVYVPELHGEMFVLEPHDAIDAVERAVGFPILTNPIDGSRYGDTDFTPTSEVIESHSTSYEIVFDFGLAVFVPKDPAVDQSLLSLCAAFAVPAAVPPR